MSTKMTPARTDEKGLTTFVPLGASDEIKLTVAMVRQFVAVPTKSKKEASDIDCIKFIALCKARRLNPFEGDAYLIGYDSQDGPKFNLITAHQAFLKRAEQSPDYDGMTSGLIVRRDDQIVEIEGDFHLDDDEVIGGWATVFFKNRSKPMHKKLRLKRFNKGFGVWREDPAGMIVKCAEADALRSSFPTMMGGMYLREEVPNDAKDKMTRPMFTTVDVPPETPSPDPTEPQPEPEPQVAEPQKPAKPAAKKADITVHDRVKMLANGAGISEKDLMDFLGFRDLAKAGDTMVDQLSKENAMIVVSGWQAIEDNIKNQS